MVLTDTSLLAWQEIEATVNDRQQAVLSALQGVDDATNTELSTILGWSINRITPRVKELRDKGLVVCAGIRECRVTGRRVYAWEWRKQYGNRP